MFHCTCIPIIIVVTLRNHERTYLRVEWSLLVVSTTKCNSLPFCLWVFSKVAAGPHPSFGTLFELITGLAPFLPPLLCCSPTGLQHMSMPLELQALSSMVGLFPPWSLQLLRWHNPIKGPETAHPARCCFFVAERGAEPSERWSATRRKKNTWAENDIFLCCLADTVQIMKEWLMFPMWGFALNSQYLCTPL